MEVYDDNGLDLDAQFLIDLDDGPAICFEGSHGTPRRNIDYDRALELLLERLGIAGATLTAVEIDTPAARERPAGERRVTVEGLPYPIALCGRDDFAALRQAIERGAAQLLPDPLVDDDPQARKPLRLRPHFPATAPVSNTWLRALLSQASVDRLAELAAIEEGAPTDPEPVYITYSRLARGQGFVHNHDQKRAIEQYAMKLGRDFLTREGWRVRTMNTVPYGHELVCLRDGLEMRVEIRGTTGAGDRVFVTAAEVEQARREPEAAALLVVYGIELRKQGERWTPRGGSLRFFEAWDPQAMGQLRAKDYVYLLPPWDDDTST